MPKKKQSRVKVAGDLVNLFKEIVSLVEKYGNIIVDFSKEQIHKINLRFHGKTIALIGPKAAGKTTFINILLNPNLQIDPMDYTPTINSEELQSKVIKYKPPMKDGKKEDTIVFKFRKPKDVGGERDFRDANDWLSVCEGVNFLFYIFDIFEYHHNKKMEKRVEEDLKWIVENNQAFAQNFEVIIFANKIDRFNPENQEERQKLINQDIEIMTEKFKNIFGDFSGHLKLISPLSLMSRSTRTNYIKEALLMVTNR